MSLCTRKVEKFMLSILKKHRNLSSANLLVNYDPLFNLSPVFSRTNSSNRMSEDHKSSLIKSLLRVATQAENSHGQPEVRPSKHPCLWKPPRQIQQLLPHMFSEDGKLLPTVTVEEQLKGLTLVWELEEAVKVLKTSVTNGCEPKSSIILDLLQQLANMGEVDCLLDLYEFLKERSLTTNLRFYRLLRDAYFNSGRIEEGVLMLRMMYHRTRDFTDTEIFFTLLTTMVLKHFEHLLPLIESFIVDLEESDPPVLSSRALLWRCYVLAEQFQKADELLANHEHVKKMLPEQVTRIVQSPLQLDYNKSTVLMWLLRLPDIQAGLKASVLDALIQHKSEEGEWLQALELISTAVNKGLKVHQQTVQVFLMKFLGQLSPQQVQQLTDWTDHLETGLDKDSS
ncbi:unnamed protein product [Candidula unifasciata]|uniref:Uncharacterized protein n=1 Tax=Candidula unifasciata TaxID=100452 RepID=A0A8S4A220_9EUPU|nr:unnamed protein product [Candidula unifasciata]